MTDDPTDPRVTLPPQPTAGRYQLGEVLGMGAMGIVYAAYDPELGRKLAVKLLRARPDDDPSTSRRFVREAKSLARVVHPNVVTIYDVGQEREQVFIAMELVEGGTLRDWMAAGNHSFDETLRLFAAIARGLNAVHKAGLVHRDFKPENVLLDRDGRPRVTDFGLARADWGDVTGSGRATPLAKPLGRSGRERLLAAMRADLTATGAIMGTPAYMAPEQHRGAAVDARADIFAFCVVMWEALFGARPFAGSSLEELWASIDEQRLVRTGTRPMRGLGTVRPILERGLRADPADRWATLDELLAQLHRLLEPPRRTGRLLGAIGVLLLVTSFASAFGVWRAQERARCQQSPFVSAWNPTRRAALVGAWGAAGEPVAQLLDQYGLQLGAVHSGACEATYLHRERSELVFDAQMECLSGLGNRMRLVVDELVQKPGIVDASEIVSKLQKPMLCLDKKSRGERRSGAQQRTFEALSRRLDEAHRDLAFGRWQAARDAYTALSTESEAAGESALVAQALVGRAQAALNTDRPATALVLFDEAIATALYAGDYAAAAAGYSTLIDIGNAIGTDFTESLRQGHLGAWAIERGGLSDHYRYHLRRSLGEAYGVNHHALESELWLRAALAATKDDSDRADVQMTLAQVLTDRRDFAGARDLLQQALGNLQGQHADPRQTMLIPLTFAYLEYATGNWAEAVRQQQIVLQRAEAQLGGANAVMITGLSDLSVYQRANGQLDLAHASAMRAYELAIALSEEQDSYRHQATLQLASIENDLAHHARAAELLKPLLSVVVGPNTTPSASQIRLHLELARAELALAATQTARANAVLHLRAAQRIGARLPRLGEIRELLDRADRFAAEHGVR